MSKAITFEDLLKKIAESSDFRVMLVHDPAKALKGAGVEATPAMISSLKALDLKSLEAVARAFPSSGVHADTLGIC